MPRGVKVEIVGEKFDRWLVIGEGERSHHHLCRCDCGTVREVLTRGLLQGSSRSCGCLAREVARNQTVGGIIRACGRCFHYRLASLAEGECRGEPRRYADATCDDFVQNNGAMRGVGA